MEIESTMRTCCGWDIGIKTLSYCKIQEIDEGTYSCNPNLFIKINSKYYNIVDWNIINLTFESENDIVESTDATTISLASKANLNSCSSCKSKAKYCNMNIFYCKKHGNPTYPLICSKPTCQVAECKTKAKFLNPANIYYGYCAKHNKTHDTMKTFKPIKKEIKTMHISLTDIGKKLYGKLNNINGLTTTETILLENQPVLKNPTMKSVQMLLYSYFIMNGIMRDNPTMYIKCYAANKKNSIVNLLAEGEQKEISSMLSATKGTEYAKRKKETVYITKMLLNQLDNENVFKRKFLNEKKQDDMADSLLMTLFYLHTNKG